jgi:hypothetical protein
MVVKGLLFTPPNQIFFPFPFSSSDEEICAMASQRAAIEICVQSVSIEKGFFS